jgi:hypothetical protein
MRIIKKEIKLGSVITTLDPNLSLDLDIQLDSILNLSSAAPRVYVSGPLPPPERPGVKWDKTPSSALLSRALANYMGQFGGHELCMLAEPSIFVNKEGLQKLLDYAAKEKVMLTWGAFMPGAFILTAQLIAYLQARIGSETFANDWRPIVHKWAAGELRHRYFDGNEFGATSFIPKAIDPMKLAPIPEEKPAKKKSVVRKVKVA